jgi:hypothetical protein
MKGSYINGLSLFWEERGVHQWYLGVGKDRMHYLAFLRKTGRAMNVIESRPISDETRPHLSSANSAQDGDGWLIKWRVVSLT